MDRRRLNEVQAHVDRESAIIRFMIVFPSFTYQAYPSYDQLEVIVAECEKRGWTPDSLCNMYASGQIDPTVDQLIREAAKGWPPAGKTVDAADLPNGNSSGEAQALLFQRMLGEEGNNENLG